MLPVNDETDIGNVKPHAECAGGRGNSIDGWEGPAVSPPLKVVRQAGSRATGSTTFDP